MDKNEISLDKGGKMEERLRGYFLDMGYFVVRGAKMMYKDVLITDIDLWLYHRTTPISREKINVDIKSKNKPTAVERIIVAKGYMTTLGCNKCIVATTDKRADIIDYGKKHGVTVLNGSFLDRLNDAKVDRLSEDELNKMLKDQFSKLTINWFGRYEEIKSTLLGDLDFALANILLFEVRDLLNFSYASGDAQPGIIRLAYLAVSYLLVVIDYLLMDLSFIDVNDKKRILEEGFLYGTTGSANIKVRLEEVAQNARVSVSKLKASVQNLPVNILSEFFGKNENGKQLFQLAKAFESLSYNATLVKPGSIAPECKTVIGVLCDFFAIDRKLILGMT